jgi:energy-converting hydrogenase Eha subunit A
MESELAVGVAALLFVGALSIKRSTLKWLVFILLGVAAAVASTGIGFALTMIGLAVTRDRNSRETFMNRAMLPTFLACKVLLFLLKRITADQSHVP